jgi:hypothetical protein
MMQQRQSFAVFLVFAALLVCSACGGQETSQSSTTPGPAEAIGVPECDDYIKKYLACVDRMPAAAQDTARSSLNQMRDQWRQAASTEQGRTGLAMSCRSAIDTARAAMSSYGCSW